MRDASTIYDKEPFERALTPKQQQEADEKYAENKKILVHLRYHLDQAENYMRIARDWLELEENDNDPNNLEDAFVALAASERELEK